MLVTYTCILYIHMYTYLLVEVSCDTVIDPLLCVVAGPPLSLLVTTLTAGHQLHTYRGREREREGGREGGRERERERERERDAHSGEETSKMHAVL